MLQVLKSKLNILIPNKRTLLVIFNYTYILKKCVGCINKINVHNWSRF